MLKLYHSYSIPSATSYKLDMQVTKPFRILKHIEALAYRLKVLVH